MAAGPRKKEEERCVARGEHRHRHHVETAIVSAAAAANRGGADGSDVARSDGRRTGPVEEHATRESAKPPHGQEEEEGAYLRRRVRLLEREVSRLRETVERLTKERAERTAEGPNSESEGQKGGSPLRGGRRKKAPETQWERL